MTRPFSALATQTAPPAKTSEFAASGVRRRFVTRSAGGVDADRLGAARDPDRACAERDAGRARIAVAADRDGEPLRDPPGLSRSRRTSPGPSSSVTQAPPAPAAMRAGLNGSSRRREHLVRGEVDASDAALVAEQHPRLARTEHDVPRLARERDASDDLVGLRVDEARASSGAIASRGGARSPPPPVRTTPAVAAAAAAMARRQRAECDRRRRRPALRQLAAQRGRARSRRARRSSRSGRPAPSRAPWRRRRRSPRGRPAGRRWRAAAARCMCA